MDHSHVVVHHYVYYYIAKIKYKIQNKKKRSKNEAQKNLLNEIALYAGSVCNLCIQKIFLKICTHRNNNNTHNHRKNIAEKYI